MQSAASHDVPVALTRAVLALAVKLIKGYYRIEGGRGDCEACPCPGSVWESRNKDGELPSKEMKEEVEPVCPYYKKQASKEEGYSVSKEEMWCGGEATGRVRNCWEVLGAEESGTTGKLVD
ncbi:hypothetical protein NDU88_001517 [Pleurodeles waltl]|uniref:Uncharacterized protein n=1 Tax=Pleurodeles waltl TaxID=8319 RepID=A0AAV7L0X4_PLEWA|nr:hypothetical protein NDU88_001517 [Pleurodeles waltl]